jgi:hypothetical protein
MSKPEPFLPAKESKILLTVYENPDKRYDTPYLAEMLHYADMLTLENVPKLTAARGTPEYKAAFRDTLEAIESLVEKGLIDGEQVRHDGWGMYYKDLKVKFKGKQAAIREKKRAGENLLGDFAKL